MKIVVSLTLLILGSFGILGELFSLKFPAASWFFDTSRRLTFLSHNNFPWYGWVTSIGTILTGITLLIRSLFNKHKHPAEIRRQQRFQEVKRGVWSLRIILLLITLASLDFLIMGNKPLAMKYDGKWHYPAFERKIYKGKDFGIPGDLADAPVNFRSLQTSFTENKERWMLMPLIPFAPANDRQPPLTQPLTLKEGIYVTTTGEPYSGLAAKVYPSKFGTEETMLHVRFRLRQGLCSGPADGWSKTGERLYSAHYEVHEKQSRLTKQTYYGDGEVAPFLNQTPETLQVIHYHPAPPNKRHLLGTDSNGNDVLAYLYGGLQVNAQAALFYIPFVYLIGVSIGLLMGYYGGVFDLMFQRIIEALEAIPFLFVIIIISSVIPVEFKGLGIIILILVSFGWMGKTYLMRTAAFKEKARDYVASAQVIGASSPRIIIRHILPNILSILVTVIPFAISGVITSITSLDYLGFGLPPQYASWGKLLNDGLSNLSSPWLVTSAFVALVGTLTLITFIGEAVREAWDPRKFTTYK